MARSEQAMLNLVQLRYGIIGSSSLIKESVQTLVQVAPTDLSVLITGETGTGKDVFSSALHNLSLRKKNPFISVNCGAIPETLLESELFGHEKGAFTGATDQRKGYFEVAHTGTIFLDEIGEMPIGTQVKLLRVLESGEFNRLGSTNVIKVDVRVVAATNRDLEYEVRRGAFRQDLFFRLNAVQLHLPPLRKHPEDIPLLVEFFANRVSERAGFTYEGISDEALEIFEHHTWRGNVRELRNVVETLVTIQRGATITKQDVFRYLPQESPDYTTTGPESTALVHVPTVHQSFPPPNQDIPIGLVYQSLLQLQHDTASIKSAFAALVERLAQMPLSPQQPLEPTQDPDDPFHNWDKSDFRLDEIERRWIAHALKQFEWNRRAAARALGISERTLYRKIDDYKLTDK